VAEPVVLAAVDPCGTTACPPDATVAAQLPAPAGRYSLGEGIARGGMGAVYRATDTVLDREVAVKVLQEKYAFDSGAGRRFAAEARITAQLQHPNIPAVHDLGTLPDGRPFLAMKLIKGQTLDSLLRQRTDPAEDRGRFVAVFEQVCQAVAYAHAHDVIHRDLKPHNVMVGRFGEVQVMDWGLAKVLGARAEEQSDPEATTAETAMISLRESDEALTRAGSVLGTPAYMPPEQAAGAVGMIDRRSDVFGLGAVLAVVLTGRPPFVASTAESARARAALGDVSECFARLDSCSADPDLVDLCKRCLAPRSEDRPADAGEVAAAVAGLRAAADERARRAELERVRVEGEQATALARSAERRKRRRLVIGAAVVLALAAVGGLTVVLAVQRQANAVQRQANVELEAVNAALRREKYIGDMNLAYHAWAENNLIRTRQLLEQHRPEPGETDLRGFEWHYLRRLFHCELQTVHAHGMATAVFFLPDGKRLVSCGESLAPRNMHFSDLPGEIKLWDVATGRQLPLGLKGPTDKVLGVALSPDGTRLAAACQDQGIRIWDLASGQESTLERHAKERDLSVCFSPDGKRLVSLSIPEGQTSSVDCVVMRVWDLAAPRVLVTVKKLSAHWDRLPFSPDGKLLAFMDNVHRVARVFDVATGQQAFSWRYGDGLIPAAVFSPDGKRLATCGERGIRFWDVASRELVATWPTASNGSCLAYSSDGRRLVVGSMEGVLELWDTSTGQKAGTLHGHAGEISMVAFSPDGARLVSAGSDGTLRVWDATGRRQAVSLSKAESNVPSILLLSPDGQVVFTEDPEGKSRFWDAATGEPRGEPIPVGESWTGFWSYDWTADGKRLLVAGTATSITVCDVATGKVVRTFPVDAEGKGVLAVSPDGKWCAHPVAGGAIKVRDVATGAELRTIGGLEDRIQCLVFSPDGSRLLGADKSGMLKLWDVATWREVAATRLSDIHIMRIRFSPDGKRLAVVGHHPQSPSGEVRALDAESGREVLSLKGHTLVVYDGAFSPDGQRLATCSRDRTIRLWDLAAGQEILTLQGHTLAVHSLRFVSDGHRLISASADRTVRIWDATPLPD
jgi:WD40 repeat protein/tRNA A-37 threonylcarbamoyl transferase component Bud32